MRWLILSLLLAFAAQGADKSILLICVDDLKPLLGCYGERGVKSPNIDRLAASGMIFERAYCNQAVCAPSRNALMTGLRPTTLGVYDLGTNFRLAAPDAVTLSQYFMRHGYRAEGLGKIFHVGHGNHDDRASWSVPHWSTEVVAYALPESRATNGLSREEALFRNVPAEKARRLSRGPAYEAGDVPDNAYPDGRLADEALRRLRAAKERGQPFFMALGFVKPHLPFCAPKKYWDMYDRSAFKLAERRTPPDDAPPYAPQFGGELRQYRGTPAQGEIPDDLQRTLIHGYHAALTFMDAQVGRVLEELDRLQLAQNTIVVLWGDHGWHLGDHGIWCKHTNYEQATRIPVIIRAPGVTKPGSKTDGLMETVDLYPTLCELAGLPTPKLEGKSLVRTLKRPNASSKEAIFHVYPRSPRGKGQILGRAVRTERYRLVEWKTPGAPAESAELELYDYEIDPGETKNLAAEQPKVVAKLRKLLAAQPEAKPQLKARPQ